MGIKQTGGGGGHKENKILLSKVNECFQLAMKPNMVFTNMCSVEEV